MHEPDSLHGLLQREIASHGPLSFPSYLELVLYHPDFGYYASGRSRIGWEGGDFFTNVSVGPVYGGLLATRIRQAWIEMGCPPRFDLIEQGVHDGTLTRDLRAEFHHHPEFLAALQHHIIEPFPRLAELQRTTLGADASSIAWHTDLPLPEPATHGFHLSNELLDAFPFHVVEWNGSFWEELRVDNSSEGEFRWSACSPTDSGLLAALQRIPTPTTAGYRTEVRTNYPEWFQAIAASLQQGRILLCDYGYPTEIYYLPERSRGTLYCYSGHRRDEEPLLQPGEKDISAHLDFTAVMDAAQPAGWNVREFADQHHFLTRTAAPWLRSMDTTDSNRPPSEEIRASLRQLQLLLHPETLGRQFHFLELEK